MKIVNVMNFIRQTEPRDYDIDLLLNFHSKGGVCDTNVGVGLPNDERRIARIKEGEKALFETARMQLALALETKTPTTFLLQYDALCDSRYLDLFKNVPDYVEVGFWFEVVKQLADDSGVSFNSKMGWTWDWHIEPGFLMSYVQQDRKKLCKTAMEKFYSCFGKYPKTVGSWLIDTYSVNYLTDNYDLDAICICRDEVNTDAYTLIGGYFNQGYFPSRNNMFTPAKSPALKINTPIIRLLGPDPLHNYDGNKYVSAEQKKNTVFTMECASDKEPDYKFVRWYYKNTFNTEDMGFSYTQIGQENSFGMFDLIGPTRMRIEEAKKIDGVEFQTMGKTGRLMKEIYKNKTPVTANVALDNWDDVDLQGVYYNCENYVASLLRYESKLFIRALYLFDENVMDHYYEATCKTFDAVYENQPVVDTVRDLDGVDTGWYINTDASFISAEKISDTDLKVSFGDGYLVFSENGISLYGGFSISFDSSRHIAEMKPSLDKICYHYGGRSYSVKIDKGFIKESQGIIKLCPLDEQLKITFEIIG